MRRRSGFTIVELLVALALIVFMMSIMAAAFSEGSKTFRAFKGLGDMNQRLRMAAGLLREDLDSPHFEGKRRLSDLNFWMTPMPYGFGPPREGFFRIWQGTALSSTAGAPYYLEGTDVDYQIQSVRATNHILHFTSKKVGNEPKDFFRTSVPFASPLVTFGSYQGRYEDPPTTLKTANASLPPAGTFTSQWAEIAWFMRANGQNANGTPLFTLYRRQRVIVGNPETGGGVQPTSLNPNLNWPSNNNLNNPNGTIPVPGTNYNINSGPQATSGNSSFIGVDNYLDISCRLTGTAPNQTIYFNSPSDLTVPQYRFSMQSGVYGGLPAATDPLTGQPTYYVLQSVGASGANATEEQTLPSLQASDAIMTDVISFSVRVMTTNSGGVFVDLPALGQSPNPQFPAAGPYVFDTWSSMVDGTVDYSQWNNTTAPATATNITQVLPPYKNVNIIAIQVQLRVWDNKTEQSRQMTLVVDM